MCGIAGIAMAGGALPSSVALGAMETALAHRGPDGTGQHVFGSIGLVHTRLAIIDLACGDQPLYAGNAALVANGEVYNYRELRAAMPGVSFATGSDCEPPLHLWREDRTGFGEKLRGMFAIAIHDMDGASLTLLRDPFGIKPLYLAETPDGVAFASEPQALLRAGWAQPALRPGAAEILLQRQFIAGRQTIFQDIERLLPGEMVVVENGRVVLRLRLPGLPEGPPESIREADALARLDSALMESVDLHQRSDVPYGLFLSGGIDSAAVLTCMARLNSTPVRAFTAGFDVRGAADERDAAAAVARASGARHTELLVTAADFWAHLPAIAACMDDPAADYAIIPTWLLARRAREEVKVVLSGEGGDEIFGGYGRYRVAARPALFRGRALFGRQAFDGLGVLRDGGPRPSRASPGDPHRTRLMNAQAADFAGWLPDDLLVKLDRCLMAHGVEGRTPLLDPGVAAAAFRLPDSLKIRNGRGKYLLRRWLAENMPAARPFAPKQGFTVPVGAWIAERGAALGPLVARNPGVAAIADPAGVETAFRRASEGRAGMAAWRLLFYALWHRAHVERGAIEGGVLDVLG